MLIYLYDDPTLQHIAMKTHGNKADLILLSYILQFHIETKEGRRRNGWRKQWLLRPFKSWPSSISLAVFVVHLNHGLFRPFKSLPPPVSNGLSPSISISAFFNFTRDLFRPFQWWTSSISVIAAYDHIRSGLFHPFQPLLSFHVAALNWVRSFSRSKRSSCKK